MEYIIILLVPCTDPIVIQFIVDFQPANNHDSVTQTYNDSLADRVVPSPSVDVVHDRESPEIGAG